MANFIVYELTTGYIKRYGNCPPGMIDTQVQEGEGVIQALYQPMYTHVNLETLEPYVGIPPEPPELPVNEKRLREYNRRGIPSEAMVVALWEKLIENRPEAAAALQAIREDVKAKYPKPN